MFLLLAFISSHFYVANGMDFVAVGDTLSGVPLSTEARYKCSFGSLWTEKSHPVDYPSDSASWSAPTFVVHSDKFSVWQRGKTASPGLRILAQTGEFSVLTVEVLSAGEDVRDIEIGYPFSVVDGALQEQDILDFAVAESAPFMSAIAKMTPSPDWFTGFSQLDIRQDTGNPDVPQMWYREFYVETYPFTAGTLSGDEYTTPGDPISPAQKIRQFTVDTEPARSKNIFVDIANTTEILPVARWTCELLNDAEFLVGNLIGDGSVVVSAIEAIEPTMVETLGESTMSPSDIITTVSSMSPSDVASMSEY